MPSYNLAELIKIAETTQRFSALVAEDMAINLDAPEIYGFVDERQNILHEMLNIERNQGIFHKYPDQLPQKINTKQLKPDIPQSVANFWIDYASTEQWSKMSTIQNYPELFPYHQDSTSPHPALPWLFELSTYWHHSLTSDQKTNLKATIWGLIHTLFT